MDAKCLRDHELASSLVADGGYVAGGMTTAHRRGFGGRVEGRAGASLGRGRVVSRLGARRHGGTEAQVRTRGGMLSRATSAYVFQIGTICDQYITYR